jgi:hypothetical protein
MDEQATRPTIWYPIVMTVFGAVSLVSGSVTVALVTSSQHPLRIVIPTAVSLALMMIAVSISWAFYFKRYVDFHLNELKTRLDSDLNQLHRELRKHEESVV